LRCIIEINERHIPTFAAGQVKGGNLILIFHDQFRLRDAMGIPAGYNLPEKLYAK
jgi:hypothetical protein